MPDVDISRAAREWPSLNDKRRSRLLEKMTPEQKLILKQALKSAKQPVKTPAAFQKAP
jgi:hypothetical protein